MTNLTIQWLFDLTDPQQLAHVFTSTRIITPSLCGKYKTVNGGPWVFAEENTLRCEECLAAEKEK